MTRRRRAQLPWATAGLAMCAITAAAFVVSHRRPVGLASELVSISSINSAKDSLTEAAASGNPGSLKSAILSAETLLKGLKEARGRVHVLKSSLQSDQTGLDSTISAAQDGIGGGADVDTELEREKESLQGSIAANAMEMRQVSAVEKAEEARARQEGIAIPSHDGGDSDIDSLKEELMRQKQKYMQAQQAYQQREEKTAEQRALQNGKKAQEERTLEEEIEHYRDARHQITEALGGGNGAGAAEVGGDVAPIAGLPGGVGGVGNRAVSVTGASRTPIPKGRAVVNKVNTDGTGIVSAFKMALGDSVESAKDAEHGKGNRREGGAPKPSLPGIVTDSWWTAAPKETTAQLIAKQAARKAKSKAVKNCHNLYSCMGNFFAGDSSKTTHDVLHLDEPLHKPKASTPHKSAEDKIAGDNMVSKVSIMQNPQEPLLSALEPSSVTHTSKLPGVAENRWGGNKFWSRLLGMPAHAKHTEHRKRMKLTH